MSDATGETAVRLEVLGRRLAAATGCDRELDRAIAQILDEGTSAGEPAAYTASVDCCLELLQRRLSGWHWHVGYDVNGVMPYAVVADGAHRCESTAATVPIALLRAITRARLALVAGNLGPSPG